MTRLAGKCLKKYFDVLFVGRCMSLKTCLGAQEDMTNIFLYGGNESSLIHHQTFSQIFRSASHKKEIVNI